MRIGIHASNTRETAGQFQFMVMFLEALFACNPEHEIYLFYFSDEDKLSLKYNKERWHWVDLKKELELSGLANKPGRVLSKFRRFFKKIARKKKENKTGIPGWMPKLSEKLSSGYKLDFIFFPIWTNYCWEWGVPFCFAVHDIQHRLQPEFPEVSTGGKWAWREKFFSNAIRRAKMVLVDSEEGKENVLRFYGCEAKKIRIFPYTIPASSALKLEAEKINKLTEELKLPRKFLFYPAQFWPHKNHYRIVEAIGILKKRYNTEIPVVFAGRAWPEWQTQAMCEALAKNYSIENQMHRFGYVSDEALVAMYARARAMVMPTFFGPTNIPYLEAFYHKCPVIASDIPGIAEQVGDAALLVDPRDTDAIAGAIYKIWTDGTLRENLIKKGQERLKEFAPERFKERLQSIIKCLVCNTRK